MNILLENIIKFLTEDKGIVGITISLNENGDPDYNSMIWESDNHSKPTEDEFNYAVERALKLEYQNLRRNEYPSIEDQLDLLYHGGLDTWREVIESIKNKYPKP